MSAGRRFAIVLVLALALPLLSATSVLAQGGSPNPSGGTRLCPSTQEGRGSVALGQFISKGLPLDLGLRAWLSSYTVSRIVSAASRPATGRTMTATAPRKVWEF
jgi:hypothetical protein